MNAESSREQRILIVDDAGHIHEDFRDVLDSSAFVGTETHETSHAMSYLAIDSAYQGEEAVELARSAASEGRPYALAFVDVRMPPGMDGVETTALLWDIDPDLQVVLCTAFADYDWCDISERLPRPENLFVLKKPFDPLEVRQMVSGLLQRRQRQRSSLERIARLSDQVRTIQDAARHSSKLCAEYSRRTQEVIDRKEAEKDQLLGDLAATVNHEVNNPLTCIITSIELALGDLGTPDCRTGEIADMLQDAQEGASRIASMAADLRSRYCDKRGGRFKVTERPTEAASHTPDQRSIPHPPPAPSATRVLVIDDDPAVVRAMVRGLRDHDVTVCTNPDEAAAMCIHGCYEVILCDYTLGSTTGQEVYEAVLAVSPEIASRMIFVTGGAMSSDASNFLKRAEIQVAYKPILPATLRKLVEDRGRRHD